MEKKKITQDKESGKLKKPDSVPIGYWNIPDILFEEKPKLSQSLAEFDLAPIQLF